MLVRDVIKALSNIKDIEVIYFNGYGFKEIGYAIDDLMKYTETNEEPVMDEPIVHFEVRNNIARIFGCFEKYMSNK